jgi:hypothetical protein
MIIMKPEVVLRGDVVLIDPCEVFLAAGSSWIRNLPRLVTVMLSIIRGPSDPAA